jgi:CRISPR/Cas system-associated exonuclease Cas4 (RecB family)
MAFFDPVIQGLSHSRLTVYEQCPRKAKYKFIDRLEEPGSTAMDRGKDIHTELQLYLEGKQPMPEYLKCEELEEFYSDLAMLPGVQCEQQIAFTKTWQPVEWFGRGVWMRVAMDAAVQEGGRVTVLDHKTGKHYPEHEQQAELYALAALHHWPDAPAVRVVFAYVDIPAMGEKTYTRADDFELLTALVNKRTALIAKDTTFVALPSPKCRWCHFRKSNGGPCEHG